MILMYFLFYGALTFGVVVLGSFRYQKKRNAKTFGRIQLNDLTLIVPFRNEEENLPEFLQCLRQSGLLPKEIIFVNDHSEDHSVAVVLGQQDRIPFTILHLPPSRFGKKLAIREALERVGTAYVLTMDADVTFNPSYFSNLNQLPQADLWILPVILTAKNNWRALLEVDLHVINAINVGLYGWYRPIIASGANLLFSFDAFHSADDFSSHAHIPSGDDIFLLRDFRKAKKKVRMMVEPAYAVYSDVPKKLSDFLHQRLRWIAKTGRVKDHFSSFLGVVQSLFSIAFVALCINALYQKDVGGVMILLFGKSLLEMVCYAPYFFKFKRFSAWLFFPVFQFTFPLYNLLLLILIPFFTPIWKGRNAKA